MRVKHVVSTLLLLFVAASIAYLIISERSGQRGSNAATKSPAAESTTMAAASTLPATAEEKPAQPPAHKLIAYYFHGEFRCHTCLTMEAYAHAAVEENFPDAIKDGRIEWRSVNVDEPKNEHFTKDFGLTSSALVLVDLRDGKQAASRDLEQIWDLVGNETKFKSYVVEETTKLLEAHS